MKYLLDINVLIAWIWTNHQHHNRVYAWKQGKGFALCPMVELGFIRVSIAACGSTMENARAILEAWKCKHNPEFIPCDISALDGLVSPSGNKTTDFYLANLAQHHGLEFATMDAGIKHPAALLI